MPPQNRGSRPRRDGDTRRHSAHSAHHAPPATALDRRAATLRCDRSARSAVSRSRTAADRPLSRHCARQRALVQRQPTARCVCSVWRRRGHRRDPAGQAAPRDRCPRRGARGAWLLDLLAERRQASGSDGGGGGVGGGSGGGAVPLRAGQHVETVRNKLEHPCPRVALLAKCCLRLGKPLAQKRVLRLEAAHFLGEQLAHRLCVGQRRKCQPNGLVDLKAAIFSSGPLLPHSRRTLDCRSSLTGPRRAGRGGGGGCGLIPAKRVKASLPAIRSLSPQARTHSSSARRRAATTAWLAPARLLDGRGGTL